MILSEDSPEVKAYLKYQNELLHRYSITVFASPYRAVLIGERQVKGCFQDQQQRLAYAAGLPFEEWFPVFVHESCHFDQWVDKAPVWWPRIGGIKPQVIIDLWLSGHIELLELQRANAIQLAIDYELDCEKRVIEKYLKWGLPIDVERATQQANAYIYFYWYIAETRRWYEVQPRLIATLVDAMPKTFDNDYAQLPDQYRSLFAQCYKAS